MPTTNIDWMEVVALAHVWDWKIGERRNVNPSDSEIRGLLTNGLLVPTDETMLKKLGIEQLPPEPTSDCGCGK